MDDIKITLNIAEQITALDKAIKAGKIGDRFVISDSLFEFKIDMIKHWIASRHYEKHGFTIEFISRNEIRKIETVKAIIESGYKFKNGQV